MEGRVKPIQPRVLCVEGATSDIVEREGRVTQIEMPLKGCTLAILCREFDVPLSEMNDLIDGKTKSDKRFSCQYYYEPPPEFPMASPCSGVHSHSNHS